jgi:hypothetical protein
MWKGRPPEKADMPWPKAESPKKADSAWRKDWPQEKLDRDWTKGAWPKKADVAWPKGRPKQSVDPVADAEAALKKLRQDPTDQKAADELERALKRLKEREKGQPPAEDNLGGKR